MTPQVGTVRQRVSGGSTFVAWLPYLLFAACVFMVFAQTIDDSYITFRYAANLAAGFGAVFNRGERVEGSTSFLHMLLCAILLKTVPSVPLLIKAKIASVACGAWIIALTGRLARSVDLTRTGCLIAQLLVAASNAFAISSVNALETTLYGALLLLALIALVREMRGDQPAFPRSGLLLFLANLARPDGMLVFACLLALRVLQVITGRRDEAKQAARWALSYVLPFCLFTLARYAYYGALLPNTYFAKHVTLSYGLNVGPRYLLGLNAYLFPLGTGSGGRDVSPHLSNLPALPRILVSLHRLCFWGLLALGIARMIRRSPDREVCAAVLLAQLIFILRCGGDWIPGWRFVVPVFPIIAIVQCAGFLGVDRTLSSDPAVTGAEPGGDLSTPLEHTPASQSLRLAAAALVMLTLALWPFLKHASLADVGFTTAEDRYVATGPLGARWVETAHFVRDQLPFGASFAASENGYAGFLNMDKRIVDLRGLTDHAISHLSDSYKSEVGVVDPNWTHPGEALYNMLRVKAPDYLLTLDYANKPPSKVLGEYHLLSTIAPPGEIPPTPPTAVYVRRSTGGQSGS